MNMTSKTILAMILTGFLAITCWTLSSEAISTEAEPAPSQVSVSEMEYDALGIDAEEPITLASSKGCCVLKPTFDRRNNRCAYTTESDCRRKANRANVKWSWHRDQSCSRVSSC